MDTAMDAVMDYEIYFRRPDDCVVFAPSPAVQDISLLHRGTDGNWHCALCGGTECRHTRAVEHRLQQSSA